MFKTTFSTSILPILWVKWEDNDLNLVGEWNGNDSLTISSTEEETALLSIGFRTCSLLTTPTQLELRKCLKWLDNHPNMTYCVLIISNFPNKQIDKATSLSLFRFSQTGIEFELGDILSENNNVKAMEGSLFIEEKQDMTDLVFNHQPNINQVREYFPLEDLPIPPQYLIESLLIEKKQKTDAFLPVSSPLSLEHNNNNPVNSIQKEIRYGYIKKHELIGWITHIMIADNRQQSLILASLDKNGALKPPSRISFSLITRVQLSVLSNKQFEIDVFLPGKQPGKELTFGKRENVKMYRFLCENPRDALNWVDLLHRTSPLLRTGYSAPPPKPPKPGNGNNIASNAKNVTSMKKKIPPPPPPLPMMQRSPKSIPPPPPKVPVRTYRTSLETSAKQNSSPSRPSRPPSSTLQNQDSPRQVERRSLDFLKQVDQKKSNDSSWIKQSENETSLDQS